MPSAKQWAAFALGVLALIVVGRIARHRPARSARSAIPQVPVARAPDRADAAIALLDASAPDLTMRVVDGGGQRSVADVAPARPLTPQQRAAANQRRDVVAAQVFRDLNQHGRHVESVQAIESTRGLRDTLRVRAADCSVSFSQDVDRNYHLRAAGFALVSCTRPDTRDTFQTGVSGP